MKGIFISYRREDTSGFARSLFQSLESHFGDEHVFIDVEAIELGVDFVDVLDQSLANCAALLVVIGKEWATCTDEEGARRITDPDDFVHIEVATALARSDVRVIPVLVRGARMPKTQDLPEDLQSLARRQAFELRHDRWNVDVQVLISALEKRVGKPPDDQHEQRTSGVDDAAKPASARSAMLTRALAITGGVLLLLMAIGFLVDEDFEPGLEKPAPQTFATEPELPAATKPAAAGDDEALIYQAQELLHELGYSPGNIDGVSGRRTVQAVRSFQRDQGMTANGRISEGLLDALFDALDASPADTGGSYTSPAGVPQLAGLWLDTDGIRYHVLQQGNQLQLEAYDAYGNLVGGGEGRVSGNRFQYTLMGADGAGYVGQGTLSPDGSRVDFRAMNTLSGMEEAGSLYRQ